jgi:GAF domain-containing protein
MAENQEVSPQSGFSNTFSQSQGLLQVLDRVSQAIAGETRLENLFPVIHEQIAQLIGDVNLLIAFYNPLTEIIEFPYVFENGKTIQIPPIPLGQGLTSIIIRSGRPLLLTKDVEKEAKELGAMISGSPAKSWLGVPLLAAGETIGAIIIQDLEHENRFSADDQRLLSTLASQIAIAFRNAHLLEESQKRAETERQIGEATDRIRETLDIEIILKTAALEMRRLMNLSEVEIRLGSQEMSGADKYAQPPIQI